MRRVRKQSGGLFSRRLALPLRRHRPHLQVRFRGTAPEGRENGCRSLASRNLIAAVPYRLHIGLTEPSLVRHWLKPNGGGIQFTNHDRHIYAFEHIFDRVCRAHQIEHRLTWIRHPWSHEDKKTVRGTVFPNGGQVERMNRTIKDATVKRFHYDDHDQLRQHLANFISAYTFGRRLKTLKGLTPYEIICKQWAIEPERFTLNPTHQMPGLNR